MNRNLLTILLLIGYTYLIFNFLTTEYSLAPRIFYTLNFISLSLILLAKAKSKKLNKHTHFLDEVQLVLEKKIFHYNVYIEYRVSSFLYFILNWFYIFKRRIPTIYPLFKCIASNVFLLY